MEYELPDGDVVLIKQSTNIEDGQIYAVEFNNQTYVKKCIFIKAIYDLFQ
nr:S24 family peptidase [Streptococcus sp. HF-100]